MTSKNIVDGADATIIAELDDAAEARIIDVLARVFTTNKYPDLKDAICRAIDRHQTDLIEHAKRAAEKQYASQQAYQHAYQQAAQQANYGNTINNTTAAYVEYMRRKQEAEPMSPLSPFNKFTF